MVVDLVSLSTASLHLGMCSEYHTFSLCLGMCPENHSTGTAEVVSLVPRASPTPFWYIFYVIKPQGGLDHDVCELGFSNYGNVPTRQIAMD